MFRLYKQTEKYYPKRIFTIKFEYLLKTPTTVLKDICDFLQINYTKDMLDFKHNIKKKSLRERYNGLDTSQIGLYKKWQKAYDGFLTQVDVDIPKVFNFLLPLSTYFKYGD